jgi:hypothetical protein
VNGMLSCFSVEQYGGSSPPNYSTPPNTGATH